MQAERANVTANVLHPGCIDTNFGKGELPFSFNKYVEGNNWLPCFTNLIFLQDYLLVSHEQEETYEQNSSYWQDKGTLTNYTLSQASGVYDLEIDIIFARE